MLIQCPECSKQISNLANFCPNCGCPNTLFNNQEKPPKTANTKPRTKKRRTKLPNGFGSIKKLSGKRRKPYAAYPPTKEFTENGAPVSVPAIGYFEDYFQALDALQDFNKNPYDIKGKQVTFADLYKLVYKAKFEDSKKQLSHKTKEAYEVAYKHCEPLYNKSFSELRKDDFQKILDDCPLRRASVENIRTLLCVMGKFAMEKELTQHNYVQYTKISIPEDDEKGEPFSEKEINLLWEHKDDEAIQIILIMIYTGFRIKAFETLQVNFEENYYRGGIKTAAGKDRIVPINPLILEIAKKQSQPIFKQANNFRNKMFTPALKKLGILTTITGKKHTPHDTRHTFSWLCDKYKVDETSKHLLMGHSMSGDVEKAKYGHRTIEELRTEIEKIKRPE